MTSFPSALTVSGLRYVPEPQPVMQPRYRVAWDDETSTYGYKCRTQQAGWPFAISAPPAVFRYYPAMQESGDYRVDISAWTNFFLGLNGGDMQAFEYWSDAGRAQFNGSGWPMMAYLVFSGNRLQGERVGEWVKFKTLRPGDLALAKGMTRATHPHYIHTFTCVKWKDGQTVHIESTGTPRGVIDFPLISKEGFGYIPWRNVIEG
jgi:hypothetical protein